MAADRLPPTEARPSGDPLWLSASALLVVLTAWAFAVRVRVYSFLTDDAFIAFRYARNFAAGNGLVWNPGERVEGYTDFAWVVLLGIAERLGAPPEVLSKVLGIASGAGVLSILVVRGTASRRGPERMLGLVAPLSLATNRTFTAWSTGGLETQLFTVLAVAGAFRFIGERERETSPRWPSAVLLALATLTRPEGVLFWAACATYWIAPRARDLRSRAFFRWFLPYGAIVGAHELFRISYYGDFVPNTFRAKVSGTYFEQGFFHLGYFATDHALWFAAPAFLVGVVAARTPAVRLSVFILVLLAVYFAAIGGDHYEFRFLVPALPLLFFTMQEGAVAAFAWCTRRDATLPGLGLASFLAAGVLFSADHPNDVLHRKARGIVTLEGSADYLARRLDDARFLRRMIDTGRLSGKETIAVMGAGAVPYVTGLPAVDVLGLSDREIARQDLVRRGVVAHEKAATLEYLARRGVVIFDVRDWLLEPRGAGPPARTFRLIGPGGTIYDGPLRCVSAEGRYLAFATTLDDAAFRRVFERFEVVF